MPPEADHEPPEEEAWRDLVGETYLVWHKRFKEASDAGFDVMTAMQFADSTVDVGELRRLVKVGCPPETIASILL